MAEAVATEPIQLPMHPGGMPMYSEMPIPRDVIFDLTPVRQGPITRTPPIIPDVVAHRSFAEAIEARERYWGHEPFCGARASYILDSEFNPIQVNGYTAAKWAAGGGSTVLGHTEWGSGWEVVTALNQWHGCFVTEVRAQGYGVHGDLVATNHPKDALVAHRQAVETVMKLRKFHGRETSPKQDVQVLLEPVASR